MVNDDSPAVVFHREAPEIIAALREVTTDDFVYFEASNGTVRECPVSSVTDRSIALGATPAVATDQPGGERPENNWLITFNDREDPYPQARAVAIDRSFNPQPVDEPDSRPWVRIQHFRDNPGTRPRDIVYLAVSDGPSPLAKRAAEPPKRSADSQKSLNRLALGGQ